MCRELVLSGGAPVDGAYDGYHCRALLTKSRCGVEYRAACGDHVFDEKYLPSSRVATLRKPQGSVCLGFLSDEQHRDAVEIAQDRLPAGLRRVRDLRVVLSIGSTHVGDDEALAGMSAFERADALAGLARLHRHKIEMADEVLVINADGYVGESTRSEIEIAMGLGKPIRYLDPVER